MCDIYVELLGEGTIVYRPVPALKVKDNIYQICGHEIYDLEIETWAFSPGMLVLVEDRCLEEKHVLVAVKEYTLKEERD